MEELADFDETHLLVRGMDVRVFESDRVTGPAFVLIHGFGVSSRYFGPLAKELSQHGRVLVLDLPGFGGTKGPGRALRITGFAHVINQSIRRLDVVKPVLIGHSMGAQVAVEALVRAPDVAHGAVLAAPVVNDRERSARMVLWRFAQSALRESPASVGASVRAFLHAGPRWLVHDFGPMLNYRIKDRVRELDVPLVVVGGQNDRVAPPDWCQRLAGVREGVEVVIVEGAAHEMIHTHSSEVARIALGFTESGLDTSQIPSTQRQSFLASPVRTGVPLSDYSTTDHAPTPQDTDQVMTREDSHALSGEATREPPKTTGPGTSRDGRSPRRPSPGLPPCGD